MLNWQTTATRRKIKRKTKRTILWIGCVVLVILAAGLAYAVRFPFGIDEYLSRRPFDSVAWNKRHDDLANATRIRMVDDLLRRHEFRGMTRDEVTAIIGEPDDTPYFKDWDMVYWLGPERGFMGIDSEWLVFRLDGQKIVNDYRIVRD